MCYKYSCKTLSNAVRKSRVKTHIGRCVSSAKATTSRIPAAASIIVLSLVQQYWLGCNVTEDHGKTSRCASRIDFVIGIE